MELKRYTSDVLAHSHDHHQLVLPVKGALEMEIDGVKNAVMTSTVAVIPSGQSHACASYGDNSFLIVDIPAQKRALENTTSSLWGAVDGNPFVNVDTSVLGYCKFLATELQHTTFSSLDKSISGTMLVNALARSVGVSNEALPPTVAKAVPQAPAPIMPMVFIVASLVIISGLYSCTARRFSVLVQRPASANNSAFVKIGRAHV